MSSMTFQERNAFEQLLGMETGYVLNFTNSSFGVLVGKVTRLDILSDKYATKGSSKAARLRQFWGLETDATVGPLLQALVDHALAMHSLSLPKQQPLLDQCRSIASRLLLGGPSIAPLKQHSRALDAPHLAEHIRRIEASLNSDPAQAIGSAKELVETCCKTILADRGKPIGGTPDMPFLTKEAFRALSLVPEGIPDSARGAEIIRRLLQNLSTVGHGLAELRGLYGTGHGKHGSAAGLKPRHAKLAVGAAATLAVFLFETHEETKK